MSLSHRITDLHRSVPKRFRHFWQVPSHVPKLRGLPAASAARYCAGTHLTPIGCAFTGRWRRSTRNRCLRLCRQFSPSRVLSCSPFRSAGRQSLRPERVQTRPTENGKQWMKGACGPEPDDRSWTSGLARATTGKGPKVTASAQRTTPSARRALVFEIQSLWPWLPPRFP